MGKQFTVAKDFVAVRYSLANPVYYQGGDTATVTDDEYSALPTSLTRTVDGDPTDVTDPVYPAYPFSQ